MTRDASETLEPFRKYLKVLADLHLDRKLRGKLDPSDVVQQSLLRAYSALGEVRDPQPEVLAAWLRRILGSSGDKCECRGKRPSPSKKAHKSRDARTKKRKSRILARTLADAVKHYERDKPLKKFHQKRSAGVHARVLIRSPSDVIHHIRRNRGDAVAPTGSRSCSPLRP